MCPASRPTRDPAHFLLTSGYGEIVAGAAPETVSGLAETAWHWDNHAVKL
jgi:hypothetical protein